MIFKPQLLRGKLYSDEIMTLSYCKTSKWCPVLAATVTLTDFRMSIAQMYFITTVQFSITAYVHRFKVQYIPYYIVQQALPLEDLASYL